MDADQNRGCCAHLRVTYSTTPTGDGHTVRGFWACETCGSRFAPLLPASSAPAACGHGDLVTQVVGMQIAMETALAALQIGQQASAARILQDGLRAADAAWKEGK